MVKVVTYLPRSKAGVHRCLQSLTRKRLFMSIVFNNVAGLQPKKKTPRQIFSCEFCVIIQNTFLLKHV